MRRRAVLEWQRRRALWPPRASEVDESQFKSVFRDLTPHAEPRTMTPGSSLLGAGPRDDRPATPVGSELSARASSLSSAYAGGASVASSSNPSRKAEKLRKAFAAADTERSHSLGS